MLRAAGPVLPLPAPIRESLDWLEALPANAPLLLPPLAVEVH
jgi:hypothetical protein